MGKITLRGDGRPRDGTKIALATRTTVEKPRAQAVNCNESMTGGREETKRRGSEILFTKTRKDVTHRRTDKASGERPNPANTARGLRPIPSPIMNYTLQQKTGTNRGGSELSDDGRVTRCPRAKNTAKTATLDH